MEKKEVENRIKELGGQLQIAQNNLLVGEKQLEQIRNSVNQLLGAIAERQMELKTINEKGIKKGEKKEG